jgi:plastocyanin
MIGCSWGRMAKTNISAESTPNITFTADRTVIQPGEPVTFRWQVEGVKKVYFFADGEDWRGHGVAGVAERQVRPAQTTAYHLRVIRLDDGVELRGIEIRVQEQATPPLAHSFSVDKTEIRPGECVTFRWHVEGVKEVCFFTQGEGWKDRGAAGVAERQVCPAQTTTYRLRVVKADDALEVHYMTVTVSS